MSLLSMNSIGSVAAFCTTLSFLPQLIRVWRRKALALAILVLKLRHGEQHEAGNEAPRGTRDKGIRKKRETRLPFLFSRSLVPMFSDL